MEPEVGQPHETGQGEGKAQGRPDAGRFNARSLRYVLRQVYRRRERGGEEGKQRERERQREGVLEDSDVLQEPGWLPRQSFAKGQKRDEITVVWHLPHRPSS